MPKPHLCLNMIVKNESARIIRALDSCKDFISTFAIIDTGSTDNTVELIYQWGRDNNVSGVIDRTPFINFSQARNEALGFARRWHSDSDAPWFDFILLMDADMELRAKPTDFENLTGTVFDAKQIAGGTSYHNIRLVSVTNTNLYKGVTHEFFDHAADAPLCATFIDHADGSNRLDKFTRDIRLLRDDLENDPDNARSWFYLANSYRDAGQYPEAATAYRRRVALGGWDEEVWHAQLDLALVIKAQGLDDAFLKEAIIAYDMRPQRAETLHFIGKHLREAGRQAAALLFLEKGIGMLPPTDRLFVQDWMYRWGFREEYSICGFYGTPEQHQRGYLITDGLATDPTVSPETRSLARSNMAWYLPKLETFASSFATREINFQPRKGYTAMNPSVCQRPNGGLEVLLRTVNYKIDSEGRYMIGPKECGDAPIDTDNWLLMVSDDLVTKDYARVVWDRPEPKFPLVIGLEDMRLFWYRGVRMFSATVREQSATGQCEMWTGALERRFGHAEVAVVKDAERISDGITTQKNWMPATNGRWMYDLRTIFHKDTGAFTTHELGVNEENIRGSSQLIPFKSGYLAVTHEAVYRGGKRVYQHRFAYFTKDLYTQRLSLPFVFEDVQIEFCAGLAAHPDGKSLVISYGVRDEKAMLATVAVEHVAMMLGAKP